MDILFSFSILKWHIIVQINRNNKLFFKDEHSYKKSVFGIDLFLGPAYHLQKLLLPINKRRSLPIRLIYTNVVEVIASANQNFSI